MEEVKPKKDNEVHIYNCGPTVYSRQHIGNYRAFAEWDVLHRALLYLGYKVNRVTNITDVGHMTSDEDFGEDKMVKSAREQKKDPLEIADEIIVTFMEDLSSLNILNPDGTKIDPKIDPKKIEDHRWTRATDYIDEMIETIKRIEANGFTYETEQAVYFDVTKFDDYTKLSGQRLEDKAVAVRDEVEQDPDKKHPADFVLWMKLVGKYENHLMKWDSPWGVGFPGWHIECTAMGCANLGEHIDIHTGGIEHISVHHTNEIAQNYAAYQHQVVDMWVHNEWLVGKKGDKMAKSQGNVYTIPELVDQGFDPLDLRYYYLSVKYRQPLYFSIEGLESARNSLKSLRGKVSDKIRKLENFKKISDGKLLEKYDTEFRNALQDDLNSAKALAVLNEVLGSDEKVEDILATVNEFDKVFGLDLVREESDVEESYPAEVIQLLAEREKARTKNDYAESDRLRDEIKKHGYTVMDSAEGQKLVKDN